MVGQVSVLNSRELRATIFAIKAVPANIRKEIRTQTRAAGLGIVRDELTSRAASPQQTAMIVKSARVTVSDQNIRVRAAASKRKLSGGASPYEQGKAFEFGTDRSKRTTYTRKGHKVTRHTARQLPPARRNGYVFYPAMADIVPRVLALWTQTTVRVIGDALDGKD